MFRSTKWLFQTLALTILLIFYYERAFQVLLFSCFSCLRYIYIYVVSTPEKACLTIAEGQSTRELVWITCIILMMASGRYSIATTPIRAVNCSLLIYTYGILFADGTWLCICDAIVRNVKDISFCSHWSICDLCFCWQMERLDWAWMKLETHLLLDGQCLPAANSKSYSSLCTCYFVSLDVSGGSSNGFDRFWFDILDFNF